MQSPRSTVGTIINAMAYSMHDEMHDSVMEQPNMEPNDPSKDCMQINKSPIGVRLLTSVYGWEKLNPKWYYCYKKS